MSAGSDENDPVLEYDAAGCDRLWWARRTAIAAALPLLLFVVLGPDPFGLTPNALDPFFYTGYAINFDDIMSTVGGGYYFVTRWSVYLPARAFSELLGDRVGRLVLRWLIATGILLSLWHLGRRWHWKPSTEVVCGVVVLTSPMFARAFLTDYVEWAVVGFGLLFICQCVERRHGALRSACIGALAAAMLVANPFAVVLCLAGIVAYLVAGPYRPQRIALDLGLVLAGFGAVLLLGLFLFRWRYDISNVYAPTLDFLSNRSGERDLLKSPRLSWMTAFVWIHVPALILVVSWTVPEVRRRLRHTFGGVALSAILVVQYGFQWIDQFVRDGNGLEISYYFVTIYPVLGVYLALLIGLFDWRWSHASLFLGAWFLLLTQGSLTDIRPPGGVVFLFMLVASVAGLIVLGVRRPAWSLSVMVLICLALQVDAPHYDPGAYHPYNMDPLYDQVYFHQANTSDVLDETIWFEERLDAVEDDASLTFLTSEMALRIVGIYAPHISGHVLEWGGGRSLDQFLADEANYRLALYGPRDFVDSRMSELDAGSTIVLDETHAGGLGYRLVVAEAPSPAHSRVEWSAGDQPSATGHEKQGWLVADPSTSAPGFMIYGPYVQLDDATYRATLEYRIDASPTEVVGVFDVARATFNGADHVTSESVGAVPLVGTNDETVTASIEFLGSSSERWEWRVNWMGSAPLAIAAVVTEPLR